MTDPTKEYLGDGVFIRLDPNSGGAILTVENGLRVTDAVYLEPDVLHSLLQYIHRRFAAPIGRKP